MEGIIGALGTKADLADLRSLGKELTKFASVSELDSLKIKLSQKAEKATTKDLEDELRESRRRTEEGLLEGLKRGEYFVKEIENISARVDQCAQREAEKADRSRTDDLLKMVRVLQRFDPEELAKRVSGEVRQAKGRLK